MANGKAIEIEMGKPNHVVIVFKDVLSHRHLDSLMPDTFTITL